MIVCHCKDVTYREIEEFLNKFPDATFSEVRQGTGASTGCGRCALSVKKVIEKIKLNQKPEQQYRLPF